MTSHATRDAARELAAALIYGVEEDVLFDLDERAEIAEAIGALAALIFDLCDDVDRLQAEREEGGRPRIVKFDVTGGRA